jgi:hypothetical protein
MAGRTRRRMWLSLGAGVMLLAAQVAMRVEAAAPLVSPSGVGTVLLGPQAMAGDLKINPGDVLRAGFDFSMPGGHPATTAVFTSGYVALLVTCPNGSSPALTIPLHDQTVVDPEDSTAWYPSGDQSSPLVYQGTLIAPDLCTGAVMDDARGALFTTAFAATDTVDRFSFRFHYGDNSTSGGWSGTAQRTAAPVAKTVAQATLIPQLSLTLSADSDSAIPGGVITYTATLGNSGATLSLAGDLYAAATGMATAAVVSYWDDIYTSTDGTTWTVIAGTAATASDYVPAVPSPGGRGLVLSPAAVAAVGVTYPPGADPILGTLIGSHDLAHWHYSASAALTPSQAAALSGGARVRNSFHVEVTPANPNVVQPSTVNVDFTGLLASSGTSGTLTNLSATIYPPVGGIAVTFNAATNPSLASLAVGASVSVSAGFTVPPPPAKASDESDTDYFAALRALEGAQFTATASASGMAGAVLVAAPPPSPVVTIEHLPIVSLAKSGPSSVGAGSVETNPLTLTNGGGASAEGLSVIDTVAGSVLPVPSAPTTLASGESATATATYSVPSAQPWGGLADTASVTWQDDNGNSYGPVSSPFTTRVVPPYGANASGLFGVLEDVEVVVGIDPATGALHTLADISDPKLALRSELAGDPGTHRLFEAEMLADYSVDPPIETARLLTIDTTTGAVSIVPLAHMIVGLAFDPASGSLYAVTAGFHRVIVQVDPKSGAETNLADFGEGTPTTGTPTALDSASHTFYLIREAPDFSSQLFSLDIVTNTLTAGPVLATPVLAIAFDLSLGTLFAVTGCCPSQSQLVRLDPVSGVEAPVGTTDLGIITSDMAIDPASHTIYITQSMNGVGTRLLSIDDVTGSVVFGPALGGAVHSLVFEL